MLDQVLAKIPGVVLGTAINVLNGAAQNPHVPVTIRDESTVQNVAKEITAQVQQEIRQDPVLQHLTNTEAHWWQKRSNWSWIVTVIVTPSLAGIGYTLAPEHQEVAAVVLGYLGNLIGGYLARRAGTASKPLFT